MRPMRKSDLSPENSSSRGFTPPRSRSVPLPALLGISMLLALTATGRVPEPFGEADVDNDPEELEVVLSEEELPAGRHQAEDEDEDGDFDRLIVGVGGGARLLGWRDFDGLSPEVEVFVSDPTRPTGTLKQTDVDGDGDAEILWVGVQGRDLDGNGALDPEENGLVVGSGDIDGDGTPEIVALDRTRRLGEYLLRGFGINRSQSDPHEVLWVGVLDDRERSTIAAIEAILDQDQDGDEEVLVRDLRAAAGEPLGFGLRVIDVDGDGDGDIWITRQ